MRHLSIPLALPAFHEAILNAIPHPFFVVDEDVRILHCNPAAESYLGATPDRILHRRGGDVLHCIRAGEAPGGCGAAPACRTCVVRGSVGRSIAGAAVSRRACRMELMRGESEVAQVHMLVTSAPVEFAGLHLALLIFEDVSELIALRGIIPICSSCRKLRNDEHYWQKVETFFHSKLDVDFSHGMCPECAHRLYPDLFGAPGSIE